MTEMVSHALIVSMLGIPGSNMAPLSARSETPGLSTIIPNQQDCCLSAFFLDLGEPVKWDFPEGSLREWERSGSAFAGNSIGLKQESPALDPSCGDHSLVPSGRLLDPRTGFFRDPRASARKLPELPRSRSRGGIFRSPKGSVVGGRIALSSQKVRAEHEIAGALRFPTGRGAQAGFTWSAFRAALNDFGRALPRFQDGVLSRAERALRVNRTWFVPNSYDAAQRS